jgi:DNA polymerase-4
MLTGLRYLFVDMNSYFASVEQQLRPELRGKPVAVLPVMADTTCCVAASYEAKAFGVRTGTPVPEARQKCPGLKFVEARTEEYIYHHHRIVAAVESCLPVTAVLSIDEMVCRLWGTDRQPERAEALGLHIKQTIRDQVGDSLKCSVGIGPNRLLAKTAAEMQKPNGLTLIGLNELPQRLYSLKLNDFCGIGLRIADRLRAVGIETVRQLCEASESQLAYVWNSPMVGRAWWRKLRGEDVPEPAGPRRTVGHSHVLPPEFRRDDLARGILIRLVHKAAARLRKLHCWARSLEIQVSFMGDAYWRTFGRIPATQDTLTFINVANELWRRKPPGKVLKVGVVLNELTTDRNTANPLLEEDRQRHDLARTMDQVNQRFGAHAIYFGGMHRFQDQAPSRISFTNIPDLMILD